MQIQRVEPELIPPATAPDRGDKVAMDRRPRKDRDAERRRRAASDTPETPEEPEVPITTYSPSGHLDAPEPGTHRLDRQA